MKKFQIIILIVLLVVQVSPSIASAFSPLFADDLPEYEETYLVATAYYSPLPDQKYYLRWNFEREVVLNGKGTHGASGKWVFTGMIAAPKSYTFGTRIWVEGLGIGSVEDRGGAIVNAWVRGHAHDRIDIWMWSGEEGLARALAWGKRTVKARIYTESAPKVEFSVTHLTQARLAASVARVSTTVASTIVLPIQPEKGVNTPVIRLDTIDQKLTEFSQIQDDLAPHIGTDSVEQTRNLQAALITLGFLKTKITGKVGPSTLKALGEFEKSSGISPVNNTRALTESTKKALLTTLIARGYTTIDVIRG